MSKKLLVVTLLAITGFALAAFEPPKIVSTSPAFWATAVNAATQKEISVTFDQALRPGFSSWLGKSSIAPDAPVGSSTTPDGLTTTLPTKLEPGKVYVFALNEKGIPASGFQTEKGISLPPTYLVFQTAGNPAPGEAPPHAIATIPTNNAQQLDPSKLKSVTITFDQAMLTAKHGLKMTENKTFIDLSKASFQYSPDGKTFTLNYGFKPASSYEFSLNSVQNIGFASAAHIPLWPARLAFTTAQTQ